MREYTERAIVLGFMENGDLDAKVSLYTMRFGKIIAKAKSIKKITSKLLGHLQQGNIIVSRIIEKNGFQIVDALKQSSLDAEPMNFYILDKMLMEEEQDIRLWNELGSGRFDWNNILSILGWDPRHASCKECGSKNIVSFYIRTQEFLCAKCVSKFPRNELIYLNSIDNKNYD